MSWLFVVVGIAWGQVDDVMVDAAIIEQCGVSDPGPSLVTDDSGWTPHLIAAASQRAGVSVFGTPAMRVRSGVQAWYGQTTSTYQYDFKVTPVQTPTSLRLEVALSVSEVGSREAVERVLSMDVVPGETVRIADLPRFPGGCALSSLYINAVSIQSDHDVDSWLVTREGAVERHFAGLSRSAERRASRRLLERSSLTAALR